jgi:hypothetical protein
VRLPFEAVLITIETDVLPRTILSPAYKFTTLWCHAIVYIMTLEDTGRKVYRLVWVSKLVKSILTLLQICRDNNTEPVIQVTWLILKIVSRRKRRLILIVYIKVRICIKMDKTNRCTEFQFYWYDNSTCYGQPFCPSTGVLSRTSALVHYMQLCWPYATRSRMAPDVIQCHPIPVRFRTPDDGDRKSVV